MKAAIVGAFLLAVGVILYIAVGRGGGSKDDKPKDPEPKPAVVAPQPAAIEIVFEYSTEKQEWLESAIAGFQKDNPDINVKLVGKGSLEAASAILDGTDKPVLWSPADSGVANLLASDWQTKNRRVPVRRQARSRSCSRRSCSSFGRTARRSCSRRARARSRGRPSTTRSARRKAGPRSAASPAGASSSSATPTRRRSNSGLEALVLMALRVLRHDQAADDRAAAGRRSSRRSSPRPRPACRTSKRRPARS